MLKKNDIKYIIKKVIIILITGFIFFNISKCNVYALSNDYYIVANNSNTNPTISTTAPALSNLVNTYLSSGITFHFYYYYAPNVFDNVLYFIFEYNNKNYLFANYYKFNSDYDISDLSYYKVEYNSQQITPSYPPNITLYDSQDESICNLGTACNLSRSYVSSFSYAYYEIDLENATLVRKTDVSLNHDILENGTIVYSNSTVPLYVNNIIKDLPVNTPPNYTEVDLTGYQGVIFYPKNYSLLNTTLVDNIEFYNFPFYYKGCINYGYFSIENTSMIVSDTSQTQQCNLSDYILVESIFPKYFNSSSGLTSIVGAVASVQYNAVVVYNRNYLENVSSDSSPYGYTSIYYDSNLFTYSLVEDFSSYSDNITYYDENGNQFTQNITNILSFEGLIENGINQANLNNNLGVKQKLDSILSLVKIPFTFLQKIYSGTCEPLTATFPHSDQQIVFPCISSELQTFIGAPAFTSIKLLINILLSYRIIISTISYIAGKLNPSDLRIEVLDL